MSGRALPMSCERSCGMCIWLQYPQLLAGIPWTDPSDQAAAADSCKWVVCCLKYTQENVLSSLSTAFKSDVSLYYLSNLPKLTLSHQKVKCFISFERNIFRRQLSSLLPLKRDWTSLPCCCECQTSAQIHGPPSSPLHQNPGCTILQDSPREEDTQVPEHSRRTLKPSSAFTGSVLSHGHFQLITWRQPSHMVNHYRNQHFWSHLRYFHWSLYQLVKFPCGGRALQAQQPGSSGFCLPFPCVAWAAVAVTCRRVAGPSVVALALLGAVLPITTLRTRLATDHALWVKKRNLRVGIAAWLDKEEMKKIKEIPN